MTDDAIVKILDKVESLAKESTNWKRDYGRMLQERDEARLEVEKLKSERDRYKAAREDLWATHTKVVEHSVEIEEELAAEKERANTATGYAEQLKVERDGLRLAIERASEVHNALQAELAFERTKKTGPVEGTWAWVCEYVEKNRGKIAARARSADEKGMIMSDDGALLNLHGGGFVTNSMDILATDWSVVES